MIWALWHKFTNIKWEFHMRDPNGKVVFPNKMVEL